MSVISKQLKTQSAQETRSTQQLKVNWQLVGGMGAAYLLALILTATLSYFGINLFA